MKAPFDLEKALAGHKLITRDGRKVTKFAAYEKDDLAYPYHARVNRDTVDYSDTGGYWAVEGFDHSLDLFLDIADEEQQATPAASEAPNPIPRAPVMPADFWTMSVCVISTGHITKEDAQIVRALDTFDNSVPDWRHFTNDTHIIRVEQIADFPDPLDDLAPHYSPEFIALCRLAREAGYTHLRLDPDGMTLSGIPSFEW